MRWNVEFTRQPVSMLTSSRRLQRSSLCVDGGDPCRIALFDGLKTFRRVPLQEGVTQRLHGLPGLVIFQRRLVPVVELPESNTLGQQFSGCLLENAGRFCRHPAGQLVQLFVAGLFAIVFVLGESLCLCLPVRAWPVVSSYRPRAVFPPYPQDWRSDGVWLPAEIPCGYPPCRRSGAS